MDLPITPYEKVGPVVLGSTRTEVRSAMASEFEMFRKSPASEMTTDNFLGKGIHVYYREPGICKAMEFHPPSNPTFHGYRLMGMPFQQIADYFRAKDSGVKMEDYGLTSLLFGINLFVPDLDEDVASPIAAIIVFEKGYYDYKYGSRSD